MRRICEICDASDKRDNEAGLRLLYENASSAVDMTWEEPIRDVRPALMPVYTLSTKLAERLTRPFHISSRRPYVLLLCFLFTWSRA